VHGEARHVYEELAHPIGLDHAIDGNRRCRPIGVKDLQRVRRGLDGCTIELEPQLSFLAIEGSLVDVEYDHLAPVLLVALRESLECDAVDRFVKIWEELGKSP
jgi:hypothetical protein